MVAASKRVLVVDDEEIVRESYRLALTDAGYSVRTVGSGRDAIRACRAERFDVLLADLKMPDMDGLEVSRVVTREFPDVRVVIITGYPSRETSDQAERLGVSDYLEKPLTPERLSQATASALARPPKRAAEAASQPDVARPVAMVTAPVSQPGPEAAKPAMGVLQGLALLAVAPLIGLAYVVFLPLVGFAMLFAILGKALLGRLGWAGR